MDVLAHCDRWTLVAVEPESGLGGGQRAIVNGPPVPLGGGFEVVAIDDLRGAVEAIDAAYAALSGSQYVGGPTEREAFRTAMEKLQPFVTEHRGQ